MMDSQATLRAEQCVALDAAAVQALNYDVDAIAHTMVHAYNSSWEWAFSAGFVFASFERDTHTSGLNSFSAMCFMVCMNREQAVLWQLRRHEFTKED